MKQRGRTGSVALSCTPRSTNSGNNDPGVVIASVAYWVFAVGQALYYYFIQFSQPPCEIGMEVSID
jgi:hypothetical protein